MIRKEHNRYEETRKSNIKKLEERRDGEMKKVEKKGKIEIGRDAEGRGSKKGSERDQEKVGNGENGIVRLKSM